MNGIRMIEFLERESAAGNIEVNSTPNGTSFDVYHVLLGVKIEVFRQLASYEDADESVWDKEGRGLIPAPQDRPRVKAIFDKAMTQKMGWLTETERHEAQADE